VQLLNEDCWYVVELKSCFTPPSKSVQRPAIDVFCLFAEGIMFHSRLLCYGVYICDLGFVYWADFGLTTAFVWNGDQSWRWNDWNLTEFGLLLVDGGWRYGTDIAAENEIFERKTSTHTSIHTQSEHQNIKIICQLHYKDPGIIQL
jgi:hypothetical protein